MEVKVHVRFTEVKFKSPCKHDFHFKQECERLVNNYPNLKK